MDTISSSFSVMVMARPPSRGTINPATNAPGSGDAGQNGGIDVLKIDTPKIACTPMTSVKKADAKTSNIVTVMKKTLGPPSTAKARQVMKIYAK